MYISGWVVPVPTENKAAFKGWVEKATAFFKAGGALDAVNGWGDFVPDGQSTSLPMAVKLEPGETVVFGWITWPDKETQEMTMGAMREHPELGMNGTLALPVDGRRIIFGTFTELNRM